MPARLLIALGSVVFCGLAAAVVGLALSLGGRPAPIPAATATAAPPEKGADVKPQPLAPAKGADAKPQPPPAATGTKITADEIDGGGIVFVRGSLRYPQEIEGFTQRGGGVAKNFLTGTVTNRRSVAARSIRLYFTLHDEGGNQVGTASAETRDLGPGKSWKFKTGEVPRGARAEFARFEIRP